MTKEQYRGGTPKKTKKKKKTAAIVFTSFVLILIAVFCVLSLTVFFKIEKIEIKGSLTYTDEEIIAVSKIKTGDNLIRIPTGDISENLQTELPFISSVKLERNFPSTLKITVTETKEELQITNGQKNLTADLGGKILKTYHGAVSEELIPFTVSKTAKLEPGKVIEFKNDREEELFYLYISFLESGKFKVNFVNISDPYDSYVKIEDRIIVKLGSSSYFDEKLSYLVSGYPKLSENVSGIFDLSSWTPETDTPRFRPQSIDEYQN